MERIKEKYKAYPVAGEENTSEDEFAFFKDPTDSDYLFDDVKQVVLNQQKVSTAFLQRKFHIGYARAARLMDMLEAEGIVEPIQGSAAQHKVIQK